MCLVLKLRQQHVGLRINIGRQTQEIALDFLLIHKGGDAVDGGLVRLAVEPGLALAVVLDERIVDESVLGSDLRCGVACDSLGNAASLDHGDRLAQALQENRSGQADDSAAEYGHIYRGIILQGRKIRTGCRADPERQLLAGGWFLHLRISFSKADSPCPLPLVGPASPRSVTGCAYPRLAF